LYDKIENNDYKVQRAILSKGDYLIEASSYRYNFISSKKVKNYERDFSWKRLLRVDLKEDEKWRERREYVKNLLDDIDYNAENLVESLTNIYKKSIVTDWRKYFIENPELIRYCGQGYITKYSDNKILLLGSSQLNHYHKELYSYLLALKCNNNNVDFTPFKYCDSIEVKSSWENSFTLFSGYNTNEIDFQIEVYYDDNAKEFLPYPYQIRCCTKNNIEFDDYPENIKEVFNSFTMEQKFEDYWYGYWLSFETEEKTISGIKEICVELEKL